MTYFDDDKQPVSVVMPDDPAQSLLEARQLMAVRICIGAESGRTLGQCADEIGVSVQVLSRMVQQYAKRIKDGLPVRRVREK